MTASFPELRLRRMRRTPALRTLTAQPEVSLSRMMWPVFALNGENKERPLPSMPGQFQYSADCLIRDLEPLVKHGLGGIVLFGVPEDEQKTPCGSYAFDSNGIVQKTIRKVKAAYPDLTLFTDVCLCAYTNHGHCGLLNANGDILNDETLTHLASTAISHAEAGADGVAPSAMMDGQIRAIRTALDASGFQETLLMSYSTKFASAMYGPFREAAGSTPGKGNRKSYQGDPMNRNAALLESILDENEGADILMVKPVLFYLDILAQLRERTLLPIAAYNVSGEYSMIHAAAERGWGDLKAMAKESLGSIQRAGADFTITYWANQFLK